MLIGSLIESTTPRDDPHGSGGPHNEGLVTAPVGPHNGSSLSILLCTNFSETTDSQILPLPSGELKLVFDRGDTDIFSRRTGEISRTRSSGRVVTLDTWKMLGAGGLDAAGASLEVSVALSVSRPKGSCCALLC